MRSRLANAKSLWPVSATPHPAAADSCIFVASPHALDRYRRDIELPSAVTEERRILIRRGARNEASAAAREEALRLQLYGATARADGLDKKLLVAQATAAELRTMEPAELGKVEDDLLAAAARVREERRRRESEAETDAACCICLSAPKSHAAVPCGHRALCSGCAADKRLRGQPCPTCRGGVEKWMRIW